MNCSAPAARVCPFCNVAAAAAATSRRPRVSRPGVALTTSLLKAKRREKRRELVALTDQQQGAAGSLTVVAAAAAGGCWFKSLLFEHFSFESPGGRLGDKDTSQGCTVAVRRSMVRLL